jgi:CheY-like chemotaxis protein
VKILIVDDIIVNRFIIKELLKKAGYSVAEANNGKEAIDLVIKDEIRLIFMDIEMPVMNGIETVHYIRTTLNIPKNKIKIFALSAYNKALLHEQFDMSEFNGVLTKPFNRDKILEIAQNAFNPAS